MPTLNFNNSTDYMESSEHLMDAVHLLQSIESQITNFEIKIAKANNDELKKSALFEISMTLPQLKSIAKVTWQQVTEEANRLNDDFEIRNDAELTEMESKGEL